MTLQEYLIKLGFSTDEPSFKKFIDTVSHAGAIVGETGGAALETAAAIELMVSRIARQYETLYFVSQRTGQSVRYIQATQFAFGQIGLNADDATQAIENFGAKMRTQPWLRAVLGGATTPQQVVQNLSRSGLPYFLQAQFAEQFAGIPEQTYFQMQRYAAAEARNQADFEKRQREAGIDPDAFAKRMSDPNNPNSFIQVLNRLESNLDIFGQRMAMDFVDPVQSGIEATDRFVQYLNRADVATKGWLGTIETLIGTTGGLWVIERIVSRLLFGGGTGPVGKVLGVAGRAAAAVVGAGTLGLAGAALIGSTTEANAPEAGRPWNQPLGPPGAGGAGAGATKRLNQAIAFFMSQGYSQAAATGIASALFFESGKTLSPTAFNPSGGGEGARGIGQWRGERLANFRKMFGKDPTQATYEEQLKFVAWELAHGTDKGALSAGNILRGGKQTAGEAGRTFIDMFERPGDQGKEAGSVASFADRLSALAAQQNNGGTTNNVTVNSNTAINLSGTGASGIASQVAAAQDKVSQGTARAVVGALR